MRTRRKSRSGGKSRRKVHWIGSHQWHGDLGPVTLTDGEVATSWAKWPAGHANTDFFNFPDEPTEETLVRSIWSPYCTLEDNGVIPILSGFVRFCTFGLIAWDAVDPDALHRVINGVGSSPDPYYGTDDWILRKCYVFVPGIEKLQLESGFPTTDVDSSSRAMRKLPPSTGILTCFSYHSPKGADLLSWGVDVRLAVKRP